MFEWKKEYKKGSVCALSIAHGLKPWAMVVYRFFLMDHNPIYAFGIRGFQSVDDRQTPFLNR
jgi:hypothetical protein